MHGGLELFHLVAKASVLIRARAAAQHPGNALAAVWELPTPARGAGGERRSTIRTVAAQPQAHKSNKGTSAACRLAESPAFRLSESERPDRLVSADSVGRH